MLEYSIYDFKASRELIIHVGENAKDNFRLIDISNRYDIWLHLKNYPSPHVVIHNNKKEISSETLFYAAELCKDHSKYHCTENLEIIYTKIKDIEKTETIGSVIIKNERFISL